MPLYAYRCANGHEFEQHGKIDGSDAPTKCLTVIDVESINCRCDAAVTKILAAPSRHFPGADSWRSKNGV